MRLKKILSLQPKLPSLKHRPPEERNILLAKLLNVSKDDLNRDISLSDLNRFTENVIAPFSLPQGIIPNAVINGDTMQLPYVTEEASIGAGASKAFKIFAKTGGVSATPGEPIMPAQAIFVCNAADTKILALFENLPSDTTLQAALLDDLRENCTTFQRLQKHGGGIIGRWRVDIMDMPAERGSDQARRGIVVSVDVNVCEAMGATYATGIGEHLCKKLAALSGASKLAGILSNDAGNRVASADVRIDPQTLSNADDPDTASEEGRKLAQGIVDMSDLAGKNEGRAVTHNKGIMNGVTAVATAFGQDSRAITSSAFTSAYRKRATQQPLATWQWSDDGYLLGHIDLPTPVGIASRMTCYHPQVAMNIKKIALLKDSADMSCVLASVGLASNLAALLALVQPGGISEGHGQLHRRSSAANQNERNETKRLKRS